MQVDPIIWHVCLRRLFFSSLDAEKYCSQANFTVRRCMDHFFVLLTPVLVALEAVIVRLMVVS